MSRESGGCGDVRMPHWVPDTASNHCQICSLPFSFFIRRHHCRKCGSLVCHACSMTFRPVPELGFDLPVRVCTICNTGNVIRAKSRNGVAGVLVGSASSPKEYKASETVVDIKKELDEKAACDSAKVPVVVADAKSATTVNPTRAPHTEVESMKEDQENEESSVREYSDDENIGDKGKSSPLEKVISSFEREERFAGLENLSDEKELTLDTSLKPQVHEKKSSETTRDRESLGLTLKSVVKPHARSKSESRVVKPILKSSTLGTREKRKSEMKPIASGSLRSERSIDSDEEGSEYKSVKFAKSPPKYSTIRKQEIQKMLKEGKISDEDAQKLLVFDSPAPSSSSTKKEYAKEKAVKRKVVDDDEEEEFVEASADGGSASGGSTGTEVQLQWMVQSILMGGAGAE